MKRLFTVVIVVLAILVAVSVAKDIIIKASVEKGVKIVTGLQLKMQSLKVGLINTFVGLKGLQLFNPAGYVDRTMLDMPEIYVDYDLPAIIKGKIHLNEMRIDMKDFTVVKNESGELNLDALKVVRAQKEGKRPQQQEKEKAPGAAPGKAPEIQIDSLTLKVGKVIYKDYSAGGAPTVKEYNVGVNERYENITDPYSLVSLILVRTLMNTGIARLTDFDLRGLQGTVSESLATARQAVTEAAAQAKEAVGQAQEAIMKGESPEEAVDALKKAGEGLKEKLKLPFGK